MREIESEYPELFPKRNEDDRGDDEGNKPDFSGIGTFVEYWGWIYVVWQLAEFNRIHREEVYKMKIREFYNELAFMKDKGHYDLELKQKQMRESGN